MIFTSLVPGFIFLAKAEFLKEDSQILIYPKNPTLQITTVLSQSRLRYPATDFAVRDI